jgi:hypothetical protein
MDKREFWSQKPALPEYHAVTFDHPEFAAPFRLVINQFAAVTLGGDVYTPVAARLQPPDSRSDGTAAMRLAFDRAVVGRQFKAALRLVAAAGSRDPITVQYDVYLGSTTTPEIGWSLYVAEGGGVVFREDTVQVLATLDNPMRADVATIYDPAVYTGLESI